MTHDHPEAKQYAAAAPELEAAAAQDCNAPKFPLSVSIEDSFVLKDASGEIVLLAGRGSYQSDKQLCEKVARACNSFGDLLLALVRYRAAQRRMLDKWANGDELVRADLWKQLHDCELAGDVAIEKATIR
ncbi:MAG TPA: hypothetical protein VFB62_01840 [Polyangiaceae bacterium]|nr:hypothetical protein [Polyangiaceae bacterium]